jgi:hypothetical protein
VSAGFFDGANADEAYHARSSETIGRVVLKVCVVRVARISGGGIL